MPRRLISFEHYCVHIEQFDMIDDTYFRSHCDSAFCESRLKQPLPEVTNLNFEIDCTANGALEVSFVII